MQASVATDKLPFCPAVRERLHAVHPDGSLHRKEALRCPANPDVGGRTYRPFATARDPIATTILIGVRGDDDSAYPARCSRHRCPSHLRLGSLSALGEHERKNAAGDWSEVVCGERRRT